MKTSCVYCGNNPVPHRFYWYSESLNILLTAPRQRLLYNPVTNFFSRQKWGLFLSKFFLALGRYLGIIKLREDVRLCKIRRAQVLWEEAEKRGIIMKELVVFGKAVDTYIAERVHPLAIIHNPLPPKIKDQRSRIIFNGLPRPEGYVNKWLDIMDDKWLLKQEFLKHGLPVPNGGSAANYNQALEIFKRIQKPVIVKPRAGSRGRHSTTFIYSEVNLKQAFQVAQQLCHWVMVEEQLFGPVYRATVINGQLAGVLRGDPPFVTGDGESNIAELIKQKNARPHPGVKDIIVSQEMERFLQRELGDRIQETRSKNQTNFKFQIPNSKPGTFVYVPGDGEAVTLSEKVGLSYGGSSSEDYEICHPDNKELFLRAAKVLGDPIVGFDYIIPDITKSYKEQRTGFIEVNSLPFINLHHDPLLGTPRNAAAMVWGMLGW